MQKRREKKKKANESSEYNQLASIACLNVRRKVLFDLRLPSESYRSVHDNDDELRGPERQNIPSDFFIFEKKIKEQ